MSSNPGSFRDPAGCVFTRDGKVYRSIFPPGVKDYEAARDKGIFDKLVNAGLLLSHREVDKCGFAPEGTVYCLNHPRLPMISYPYEWPFSMLKDAALIHLDAMEVLIPEGFWLRDASTFNVQYDGRGLRLIDTLSVGRRTPESPWAGYGQFCSHFLAPLAIAAYRDIRTLSLWRNYMDGYPLDLASSLLPFKRRYQPRLFIHLNLHARFQEFAEGKKFIDKPHSLKKARVTDLALMALVRSLRRTVEGIKWRRTFGIWQDYKKIRPYLEGEVARKSGYVERVVERIRPAVVWDLGGNTGEFSMIAASRGAFVVSIDKDPACTEYLYHRACREKGTGRILPLTMDLANPSPGLGWDGRERLSLKERGSADLVLALALIHHLVFSCNVPLPLIARWFGEITEYLLVEFIPPSDPMVKKLVINRADGQLPYSMDAFRSSFGGLFDFIDQTRLSNDRTLFLCRRK